MNDNERDSYCPELTPSNIIPASVNAQYGHFCIRQLAAYYECASQAKAIMNYCTNPAIIQQLMEALTVQSESMIRPIRNYEMLVTICQGLYFEDDMNSKRVLAVAHLPAEADVPTAQCHTDPQTAHTGRFYPGCCQRVCRPEVHQA